MDRPKFIGSNQTEESTSSKGYQTTYILYEPRHEISNNVVCGTSKVSDQPAQKRSLIRAFASLLSKLHCTD